VNFLAHLVLSPGGEEIMAGNFFADRVKGQRWKELPDGYAQGVLLHRRIDHFVDQHPLVKEAKSHMHPRFGLFRGVLLDVFWDHYLARDFQRHTPHSLLDFSQNAHRILADHASLFHPQAEHLVEAMQQGKWLNGYSNFNALDRILKQMASRFPHENPMGDGLLALKTHYLEYEALFERLWPELTAEFGLFSPA
jgi:acyl carrier protein phosphodiesterase